MPVSHRSTSSPRTSSRTSSTHSPWWTNTRGMERCPNSADCVDVVLRHNGHLRLRRHGMRQLAYTVGLIALIGQGLAAQAANGPVLTDEAYMKTMKEIGPTFQTLIKNNESMDH